MTVFEDDLIDDFAAQNTSPPEKLFTGAVEFFEDHNPSATVALHNNLHTEIFQLLMQILYQTAPTSLNTMVSVTTPQGVPTEKTGVGSPEKACGGTLKK